MVRARSLVMVFHPLLAPGLHVVPLLLLVRVKQPADLSVGILMNFHHLRATIILRKGRILAKTLHLGLLRLKGILHLGLLIRGEVQMLGQFLGALGRILRAVMPAAMFLRRL